jgi:hypothetical protein
MTALLAARGLKKTFGAVVAADVQIPQLALEMDALGNVLVAAACNAGVATTHQASMFGGNSLSMLVARPNTTISPASTDQLPKICRSNLAGRCEKGSDPG